jgi:hypothetical protein
MENHEISYVCALAERAIEAMRQDPRKNRSFIVFIVNCDDVRGRNYTA